MYSVKLAKMQVGDGLASLKLKYERAQSPTPENSLNGLFDYTTIAKSLLSEPVQNRTSIGSFNAKARAVLQEELTRQNIGPAKFKQVFKQMPEQLLTGSQRAAFTMQTTPEKIAVRMQGTIDQAEINHEHFLANQKNNETGNSVERLYWVIKLEGNNDPQFIDAMKMLDTDSIRSRIDSHARVGLKKGHALELINDAVKILISQTMTENSISDYRGKFSLKRPGVLDGALVVIGESAQFGKRTDSVAAH
ncbi:MAG: hypothetical protein V4695_00920 [Pseudomonadota bacterium]